MVLSSAGSQAALMYMEKRLQHDFLRLGRDIKTFQQRVHIAPTLQASLGADGQALAAQVKSAANPSTIEEFAIDAKGLGGAPIPSDRQTVLRADMIGIFQSEGITDSTLMGQASSDELAVIASPGLTPKLLQRLIADELAVSVDTSATGGIWPGAPLL